MARGLVSLFEHIGDDNLRFQWLFQCATKINTKKKETSITFVTEHENLTADNVLNNTNDKIGIIVWIDVADWESWKNNKEG